MNLINPINAINAPNVIMENVLGRRFEIKKMGRRPKM